MCGRFVIATPLGFMLDFFDIHDSRIEDHRPRYNVAPSTPIYIVRDDGEVRTLDRASWGFTPAWAKGLNDGPRPINARSEGVASSRLFRNAFRQRRCLVPADGYYEWQARPGQRKLPHYIHRADGTMMAFGGIWETWHAGDEDEVTSVAILTTPASGPMNDIHDRMPLILEPEDWQVWLTGPDPADLLHPADDALLRWHSVTTEVGNVRNDSPELIEPVETKIGLPIPEETP